MSRFRPRTKWLSGPRPFKPATVTVESDHERAVRQAKDRAAMDAEEEAFQSAVDSDQLQKRQTGRHSSDLNNDRQKYAADDEAQKLRAEGE